jgi:hypothetical protein
MIEGYQLNKHMGPTDDNSRDEVRHTVNKMFFVAIQEQFGHSLRTWDGVVSYYAQHVSTIGWIAKQVGVVISLAHSIMGRAMSNPCVAAFQGIKRIYRYLQGHIDLALTLSAPRTLQWGVDNIEFHMQSDASFADDQSDAKSQGGYFGFSQVPLRQRRITVVGQPNKEFM